MSQDEKDRTVERYLKGAKKQRTREERKKLEAQARLRKESKKRRGRQRIGDWRDVDEETAARLSFERLYKASEHEHREPPPLPDLEPEATGERGEVFGRGPAVAHVRLTTGEHVDAVVPPRIRALGPGAVAVGDEVLVDAGRLVAVLERRTVLSRPDPSDPRSERVLAANVDVGVAVVAAAEPTWKPRLIDRLLAAFARGGLDAAVFVNKCDLVDAATRRAIRARTDPYRTLGHAVILGSVRDDKGVNELREALVGRTAVVVGPSGVGKSSLLNAMIPDLDARTGHVRSSDGKGRHTTTAASLHELPGGGRLVDTPGVRAFGLFATDADALLESFPEIAALAGRCRFRDCGHDAEPGCAVRTGVEDGELDAARLDAWHRLRASLEE